MASPSSTSRNELVCLMSLETKTSVSQTESGEIWKKLIWSSHDHQEIRNLPRAEAMSLRKPCINNVQEDEEAWWDRARARSDGATAAATNSRPANIKVTSLEYASVGPARSPMACAYVDIAQIRASDWQSQSSPRAPKRESDDNIERGQHGIV